MKTRNTGEINLDTFAAVLFHVLRKRVYFMASSLQNITQNSGAYFENAINVSVWDFQL